MDIIVTVDDALVPRILAAFDTGGGKGVALSDIQAALKAVLKDRVLNHETSAAAFTKAASIAQETW